MKRTWWMATLLLAVLTGAALAQQWTGQTQNPDGPQMSAPRAWNDLDKDGLCDVCGRPTGQGYQRGWRRAGAQQDIVPAQGLGRGGAPYARNDKDKDGICDITGQPVGQGRGWGAGRRVAALPNAPWQAQR